MTMLSSIVVGKVINKLIRFDFYVLVVNLKQVIFYELIIT